MEGISCYSSAERQNTKIKITKYKDKNTKTPHSGPEARVMDRLKGTAKLIHGGNIVPPHQSSPFKYQCLISRCQSPAPIVLTNPSTQHKEWKLWSALCSYPGQDDNTGMLRGIPSAETSLSPEWSRS